MTKLRTALAKFKPLATEAETNTAFAAKLTDNELQEFIVRQTQVLIRTTNILSVLKTEVKLRGLYDPEQTKKEELT